MQEATNSSGPASEHAAFQHEHHKSHRIGESFAHAHGRHHDGPTMPSAPGPMPGPENVEVGQQFLPGQQQ